MPLLSRLVPRQQKAQAAVDLIRATTTDLINQCKAMVDAEEEVMPLTMLFLGGCGDMEALHRHSQMEIPDLGNRNSVAMGLMWIIRSRPSSQGEI